MNVFKRIHFLLALLVLEDEVGSSRKISRRDEYRRDPLVTVDYFLGRAAGSIFGSGF